MNDNDIVKGLRNGDSKTINYIYNDYRSIAISLSKKHNFSSPDIDKDIDDIFQEAMMALVKMVNNPDFKLDSKFSTLFYSIYKRQALKLYSKNVRIDYGEEVDFLPPPCETANRDNRVFQKIGRWYRCANQNV